MLDKILTWIALGALLLGAVQNTILNLDLKDSLLSKYCLYLWLSFARIAIIGYFLETNLFETTASIVSGSAVLADLLFYVSTSYYLDFVGTALGVKKNNPRIYTLLLKAELFLSSLSFTFITIIRFHFITYWYLAVLALIIVGVFYLFKGVYELLLFRKYPKTKFSWLIFAGAICMALSLFLACISQFFYGSFNFHNPLPKFNYITFNNIGILADVLLFSLAMGSNHTQTLKDRIAATNKIAPLLERLNKIDLEMGLLQLGAKMENEEALAQQQLGIAREIHDGIGSSLVALQLYVTDLKQLLSNDKKTFKLLGYMEEEARSVYAQTRFFAQEISKNALQQNYHFQHFLDNLSDRFGSSSSLTIHVSADKPNISQYFTQVHHKQMSLLVKEAVANTIKHAGATTMHINLYVTDENIFHFSIKDNGKWKVPSNTVGKGVGLTGIRERVAALGGHIRFETKEDGTALLGRFPLESTVDSVLEVM